jgi:16S rRNA (uracil1498-N3)-methyltransferase
VGEGSWFIAPSEDWRAGEVLLDAEESHHALDVLRLSRSAELWISDGEGTVARCSVEAVQDGRLLAKIVESQDHARPRPEIVVYQGAPKGGKLDDLIERLAQLGVAELCVFESSRTVVRWDDSKRGRLAERWRAIARGAAKQSRHPFVMRTAPPGPWPDLLDRVAAEGVALTLWEGASASLRSRLPKEPGRIAIIVGPEGGLAVEEAEALDSAGAAPVSLGPHIFRTEMAPVVACSALLWHYGLIG